MPDLTNHEFAILLLADEGESLIPIGIWEKPIKNLVALGLLKKNDSVNYVITPEGRAARIARDENDGAELERILAQGKRDDSVGVISIADDVEPSLPTRTMIGLGDE